MLSNTSTYEKGLKEQGALDFRQKMDAELATLSPQAHLDSLLLSRGYANKKYVTLSTGYYAKPTALQKASFDANLIRLCQEKNAQSLKAILDVGLSPNPCNAHGESLLHIICRRGDVKLLEAQLEAGGSVQVSDNCGRTPLHENCKMEKPCFEMATLIANRDLNLFHMLDNNGDTPLSCVPKECWSQWINFLNVHKDIWWPQNEASVIIQSISPLVRAPPNSAPLPDPKNAMTVEMAYAVASGSVSPGDALLFSFDSSKAWDHDFSSAQGVEDDFDNHVLQVTKHLSKLNHTPRRPSVRNLVNGTFRRH